MESEIIKLANEIIQWLKDRATEANKTALVVGVSGGVDSGLVSTLCAMTGLPTYCVVMPCESASVQTSRSYRHISWLTNKYDNTKTEIVDLLIPFLSFKKEIGKLRDNDLAYANTKSRLRMTTLYHVATCVDGLVVGTGNKVEDFGVGFFTKYGDGGVDISPIADLMKSEVRKMARELGVSPEITEATPTDGLWADGRSDEDAIGATYEELEWAMKEYEKPSDEPLTARQAEVMKIYRTRHLATLHKLEPIPTFKRK
jgi:NAD+ synthase